ncbi:MAG TPA: uroporphyrinogen-III synthase [Gemmataceae bacterium]|nr:uroporphyrinogen-III synthase [Gemmataceae bacterium]
MTLPLQGRTVALAEGRQLEELAEMIEAEGATAVRCPLVNILDAPDPGPVVAWLRELVSGRFAYIILMTGEGVRRLLGFAERAGLRAAVIAALARTRTVTRGPKPARALKEVGLAPREAARMPTTEGVIETLRHHDLSGLAIGVQMYSEENPVLMEFLRAAGASAWPVLPYVYGPKTDGEQVADLIGRMSRGEIDVLVFTSSPQVDRLYEVAAEGGLEAELRQGLERTRVAAVGPVAADNLRQHGARVDVCPEQGWVMKNLVLQIKRVVGPAPP